MQRRVTATQRAEAWAFKRSPIRRSGYANYLKSTALGSPRVPPPFQKIMFYILVYIIFDHDLVLFAMLVQHRADVNEAWVCSTVAAGRVGAVDPAEDPGSGTIRAQTSPNSRHHHRPVTAVKPTHLNTLRMFGYRTVCATFVSLTGHEFCWIKNEELGAG